LLKWGGLRLWPPTASASGGSCTTGYLIREEPDAAEANIRSIMKTLNQTIADIRRYIYDLASGEGELEERLSQLTAEMRSQTGLTIDYRIEGKPPRLPEAVQEHIFQIVREATIRSRAGGGTVVEVEIPYLNTSIWQPSPHSSSNNGDRQGASHETPAHPSG